MVLDVVLGQDRINLVIISKKMNLKVSAFILEIFSF